MAENANKTNHVVYRSSNGQLIDIYYMREPGWRSANHAVSNNAPPMVGNPSAFVYPVNNSQNIVFRGADGNIYCFVFVRGQGWRVENLTALTGAPSPSADVSTYTYHVFNTRHVMYSSQDGHVHQLYSPPAGDWRHADMTEQYGAPLIEGKPTTYVNSVDDSQNTVYRGKDGHIYLLHFVRGAGWDNTNITQAVGAPPSASNPASYTYHVFNTQHVMYRSADGHLHQLYAPPGQGWKHSDMTVEFGIPPMVGKPAPFVDAVDNSQSVAYRGIDGHIHFVSFIRGEGWKHLNLSATLGTPTGKGNPYGYTFDLFKTKHIMYSGQDGNIYQLYLPPGKEWRQSNLSTTTGAPQADGDPYCYTYDLQ